MFIIEVNRHELYYTTWGVSILVFMDVQHCWWREDRYGINSGDKTAAHCYQS